MKRTLIGIVVLLVGCTDEIPKNIMQEANDLCISFGGLARASFDPDIWIDNKTRYEIDSICMSGVKVHKEITQ